MTDDVDNMVDALSGQPAGMDVRTARRMWRGATAPHPDIDPVDFLTQAGLTALPFGVGKVAPYLARGIGSLISSSPKLATGLGATTVAAVPSATEGESANRLTKDQIKLLREQQQINAQAAATSVATEKERAQNALNAQKSQQDADRQLQLQNEEDTRQKKIQEQHDWDYSPFQKRYPGLAEALPIAGAIAAASVPYAGRVGNIMSQRIASRPWFNALKEGEAAKNLPVTAENVGTRTAARNELEALSSRTGKGKDSPFVYPPPQVGPLNRWVKGAGVGAGVEGAMAQPEYNAAVLPADSPDKYPDPTQLAVRLLMAGAAGSGPVMLGTHVPVPIPPAVVPMARIEALAKTLKPPTVRNRPSAKK